MYHKVIHILVNYPLQPTYRHTYLLYKIISKEVFHDLSRRCLQSKNKLESLEDKDFKELFNCCIANLEFVSK